MIHVPTLAVENQLIIKLSDSLAFIYMNLTEFIATPIQK